MRGREVPACSDHSMTKRFSILIRSPHTEDPRCTCKVAWHCTLQGTSRIERSSLAPCQLKGIHFATFFLDPLFMARRSEVSGLRMTSSCGQRLARSAMMAGDAGIEIWKVRRIQTSPSEDWVFHVELPTVIPTYLERAGKQESCPLSRSVLFTF